MAEDKSFKYVSWQDNFKKYQLSNTFGFGDICNKDTVNCATLEREKLNKKEKGESMAKKKHQRLVKKLTMRCKKTNVFREKKVQEIKRLIENNEYHVSAEDIVDKMLQD